MNKWIFNLPLVLLFLAACNNKELPAPPKANKIPVELTAHGHTRVDNY